jgi:hypothetical protein
MLERDTEMRGDLSPAHVRGLEAMMKAVNAEKFDMVPPSRWTGLVDR